MLVAETAAAVGPEVADSTKASGLPLPADGEEGKTDEAERRAITPSTILAINEAASSTNRRGFIIRVALARAPARKRKPWDLSSYR